MRAKQMLILIKIIHTLVWIFFNVVIFYMLYAVTLGEINHWLWVCYGLIALEGLALLMFRFYCPLTVIARRYSDSQKHNFDIYLPEWLAKYNKQIYISILALIIGLTIWRISAPAGRDRRHTTTTSLIQSVKTNTI